MLVTHQEKHNGHNVNETRVIKSGGGEPAIREYNAWTLYTLYGIVRSKYTVH